jgi:hypothetical protein
MNSGQNISIYLINQGQKHVTIRYSGWNAENGTVAYMPLPENISLNPRIWKSERFNNNAPSN